MTSLTPAQRHQRIITNLKGNKPSIMPSRFAAYAAHERGERYIAPPTFLILNKHFTFEQLQGVYAEIREEHKDTKQQSEDADENDKEIKNHNENDNNQTENDNPKVSFTPLEISPTKYTRYDETQKVSVQGEELRCVKLPLGGTRYWWDVLTTRLQPENWPETMEFYVEHLTAQVVDSEGIRMEALRVRRHFAEGE